MINLLSASPPKVSVVCAWYNRADYICETIDSLFALEFDSFDITVVNDGSSDPRVREILDSYDDPRLRVIHQKNTGFVNAIRRAINESQGEYIAIQGAGDVSMQQRLAIQSAFLTDHPNFAVVGCRYANVVTTSEGESLRRPNKIRKIAPVAADIIRGNPFGHGEVMIRRKHYTEVGGYRPFFVNAQDKDLWMRLSMTHRLGIVPDELYERRIFQQDGIASDLKKTLKQIAYSRLADLCHKERLSGKMDVVETYGQLALMRVPGGPRTTYRILRAVRQINILGNLNPSQIKYVFFLFGVFNGVVAYIFALILQLFNNPKS